MALIERDGLPIMVIFHGYVSHNQRVPETFDCGAILGNSLQISSHLPWFLTEMMMSCEPLKIPWLIDCYLGDYTTWFTGDYDNP